MAWPMLFKRRWLPVCVLVVPFWMMMVVAAYRLWLIVIRADQALEPISAILFGKRSLITMNNDLDAHWYEAQ